MKRLLLVLLIAGCVQHKPAVQPAPIVITEYRAVTGACQPFEEQLRQMTQERDKWKSYANSLEKLP